MADVTPAVLREAADVLGIQERASLNEIRQNYHEQIKKWHPDVSQQDAVLSHE
jgi:DnaJ-class molecular chaperone